MIKAVIFDFDGLILDTESHEYTSLQEIYKEHGTHLPIDVWGKCVGTHANFFNPFAYLEECIGKKLDHEELKLLRKEKYNQLMQHEEARPGVREYLEEAKKLGLRIGLASSSTRSWVSGYLEQLGLLSYFEKIRTSDDVPEVKPNPQLYLDCLDALQVKPEEAIAFEDSPNGALAAKRAGMYCVVVPNSITENLTFGEVDKKLNLLTDITLPDLIEELEKG